VSKLSTKTAAFLLRDPTLSETHIAFSYGSNIWVSNRDGGDLRRLTTAGQEGMPAISPNGEQIAFIGEYGGPRGVFVMPVAGGEARRVTHHPDDLGTAINRAGDALAWTPDGNRVLFGSRRAAFAGGSYPVVQLFTVPAVGGPVIPIPLVRAVQGSFSPDSKRIAYVPNVRMQPEWKGYRGGQTTPIQIADLGESRVEATIPRDNSNDFNPMWVGDIIYFLSDRNGPVTLFSYDVKSRRVREVVKNNDFDLKSASASSEAIVYEQLGSLHLLDLRSGVDRVLDICPVADFPEVRPHYKVIGDIVGTDSEYPKVAAKLSPSGSCAAFGLRGEILTVSAERNEIRNLTRTPGAVERDPVWSPDGASVAYFSDESGEYALHICGQTGLGKVRKIDLGCPPSFYYSPLWSPDGRRIAYTDKRLNYWYVDIEGGAPVRVDTGFRVDPVRIVQDPSCRHPMAWSPDGRWLAYIKMLENHLHAAFVHSIEKGRSHQLTDGTSDVLHAVFDKAGEYLYFTATTEVGLAADWVSMSRLGRAVTRNVYALKLDGKIRSSLTPCADGDNKTTRCAPKGGMVEITLDGILTRIARLQIPARNYSDLYTGPDGVLFLVEAPIEQSFSGQPRQVHRFDRATQRTDRILQDICQFDVSLNGDKVLYAKTQDRKRRWFIASGGTSMDWSREPSTKMLDLDSMEVYVDPRVEWEHLFEQVWRIQRDFLYDPGLHGLNLEKVKEKYRPFLKNIVCRSDLYYLFGEMLGNLNVGHLFAIPLEDLRRQRAKVGLLGAEYGVDRGRYRFARIYEGDPWHLVARSPLTEAGNRVEAGEYLLAVNGRDVLPSAEVFSYFENTAGREVVLTVGPEPDGNRSRSVTVVPLDDEYPLRYYAWIEGNRRKVDQLSGGRVAYVHVPDCRLAGYESFNRYFFAQVGKEAVIIDGRYNNGGDLPDYIIDCLKKELICYWHVRDGQDLVTPSLSIFGPKVMLINEMACSMGDMLPWMFRKSDLGPLIGKRTWGGLVGFYAHADDLLDNGLLGEPNFAFYTPEGEWEVENCGVSPDIEVEDDPSAARTGHDVQLERAIEVVTELLKNRSPPRPQRPAYPRYKA